MKVLNICLSGPFSDGWNYQDNLLTKYQKINGNDVTIIAPKWSWNSKGELQFIDKDIYYNEDGVKIIRLNMKNKENINKKFKRYCNLYNVIEQEAPDVLFVHGCQFLDLKYVSKYVKNHKVLLFIDNHADFSNSATNFFSKYILHGIIWRHNVRNIKPYVNKFYGVLPARVDFLHNVYGIPMSSIELLVMGADDEYIKKYCTNDNYLSMRKKYHIRNDDFVIVTGGKIDHAKLQTLTLMKSIKALDNKKIKLFVFGSVDKSVKSEFDSLCDENTIYLGWADTIMAYEFFNMADLVAFPGRHSVFWEQVVAIGKPMICKYWEGTTHIDIGGNVIFLYNDSVEEYKTIINDLYLNIDDKYTLLLNNSKKNEKNEFLYSEIAKKSIGSEKKNV